MNPMDLQRVNQVSPYKVSWDNGEYPGEFQVKEDRSSRSDYNVWNEDWNK